MPKVNVNGVGINYDTVGEGPHTLLCLPGFLGTTFRDFGAVFDKLDRTKFRLVAWDPPGIGKSYPPKREFKINWLEKDVVFLEGLVEAIGLDRFSIIGWSQGGSTGIIFAAKNPSKVIKLITIGSQANFDEIAVERLISVLDESETWPDSFLSHHLEFYSREYVRSISEDMTRLAKQYLDNADGHYLGRAPANVKCPWLILHGEVDTYCGSYHAENLQKMNKSAKLLIVPKGRHDLHLTSTDVFLGILENFIFESHSE